MNKHAFSPAQLWPMALILAPFAVLLCCIFRFAVNAPFSDEWALVDHLQKSFDGALTVRNLFDQHNESRIFFPRIVLIGLARMTDWNIFYEIGAIVVCAALLLALLSERALRPGPGCSPRIARWLPFFFSLQIFSLIQYECWTFGFTLVGYMNILFVVAGLSALAIKPFTSRAFVCAIIAGIIATFSYANGILFWPAGFLMLAMTWLERGERLSSLRSDSGTIPRAIIWFAAAAAIALLYFAGYHKPGLHPSMFFFVQYPLVFSGYVLAFIGGAIVNIPGIAMTAPVSAGVLGLALFAACASAWLGRSFRTAHPFSFWLALSSFSLMTGLAAALGRAPYGVRQALDSRYTMFSGLFWISVLVMSLCLVERANRILLDRGRTMARRAMNIAAASIAALCLLSFLTSSFLALQHWSERHEWMADMRNELLTANPDLELLARSVPHTGCLMEWANWAKSQKLSLFRNMKDFGEYVPAEEQAGAISSVECDIEPRSAFRDGLFSISGTISWTTPHCSAIAVLVVNSNDMVLARTHMSSGIGNWTIPLKAAKLPEGKSVLRVFALHEDNTHVGLIGELDLEIVTLSALKEIFKDDVFIDQSDPVAGHSDIFFLDGDIVRGSGWATDQEMNLPGKWVAAVSDATNLLAFARVRDDRKDVADIFRNKAMLKCGWRIAFDKSELQPGTNSLSAVLLLPGQRKAIRLRGEFEVVIP